MTIDGARALNYRLPVDEYRRCRTFKRKERTMTSLVPLERSPLLEALQSVVDWMDHCDPMAYAGDPRYERAAHLRRLAETYETICIRFNAERNETDDPTESRNLSDFAMRLNDWIIREIEFFLHDAGIASPEHGRAHSLDGILKSVRAKMEPVRQWIAAHTALDRESDPLYEQGMALESTDREFVAVCGDHFRWERYAPHSQASWAFTKIMAGPIQEAGEMLAHSAEMFMRDIRKQEDTRPSECIKEEPAECI